MQPKRLLVVTGEASGEMYAAHLVRALKEQAPELECVGIGSTLMAEAGVELLFDNSDWGAMGFFEAVKGLPSYLYVKRLLERELVLNKPDLVLLVDFGAFNSRIAAKAKALGRKVLYFLPPKSWSREERDWSPFAAVTDAVATQFPWSETLLRASGVNATYVGHPLMDLLKDALPKSQEEATAVRDFGDAPVIGLLPGSRHAELRHMLSPLLVAGYHLRKRLPKAKLLVSRARPVLQRHFDKRAEAIRELDIEVRDEVHSLLLDCDFVLACSGTVTLEAALLVRPMLIAYRANPLHWVQYLALRPTMFGLPNIIAGRHIVPELIQPSGAELARAALRLLESPSLLRAQRQSLWLECANALKPGAFDGTVKLALELLDKEAAS